MKDESPVADKLPRSVAVYSALDAATEAIAGVVSVDQALQVIVDQVRPLVGAQYAALGIVDGRGLIERFVTSGLSPADRLKIGALPRGHGLLGLIIRGSQSFRIAEISDHPQSSGFPPNHPSMHSFLGVPVTVKGRSIGNLYLTNKQGSAVFSAEDEGLVEIFARHAGIAIENARLHEQVQRLAVVDERERIGKDLHDGIIQSIYAVGLSLEDVAELMAEDPAEVVRRVEVAIDDLHMTIRDIRNFIFGLRPELLGGTSLLGGLATLVEEFRHNTVIDIELRTTGIRQEPGAEVTAQILGITNEALSNVARHSKATRASVQVSDRELDGLEIAISDNGKGFNTEVGPLLGHLGTPNMRSRAIQIGATMTLVSAPGAGTQVRVQLPAVGPPSVDQRGAP